MPDDGSIFYDRVFNAGSSPTTDLIVDPLTGLLFGAPNSWDFDDHWAGDHVPNSDDVVFINRMNYYPVITGPGRPNGPIVVVQEPRKAYSLQIVKTNTGHLRRRSPRDGIASHDG